MSPTTADFNRSLDTGLPSQYELLQAVTERKPGSRLYQRIVKCCEQCHCFCTGTQFRPSTCSQTGKEVKGHLAPPLSCPLPLYE